MSVSNDEKGGVIGRDTEKTGSSDSRTASQQSETTAANKNADEGAVVDDDDVVSPSDATSRPAPFRRDIVFADEVKRPLRDLSNEDRIPERRTKDQHIAFVENQRNPEDSSTLYIPGPRDVERGYRPQRVEEADSGSDLVRQTTQEDPLDSQNPNEINGDDHPHKGSKRQRLRSGLSKLRAGRKGTQPKDDDELSVGVGVREKIASRSGTFASYLSQDKNASDPLPYLSYAATIGRNSTFVDLTEEQREELGGIEYRC